MAKILVNRAPVSGPWGGGNKTVQCLCEALQNAGHDVVHSLQHSIDLLICIDPRGSGAMPSGQDICRYKEQYGAKVIQRVGDVGSHGKPHLTGMVKEMVNQSDFIIFPSLWAKDYINYQKNNFKIIHNGPLEVFYRFRKDNNKNETISLITHHWSPNPRKGYALYQDLDSEINNLNMKFTYLGRLQPGISLKNAKYIPPIGDNNQIAKILSEHNIYLTASEEEAGANHVLEAMAAGLPVVYRDNGGSINEYCSDFGESYSTFEEMINIIKVVNSNYEFYKKKVLSYNNNINKVINEYLKVINELQN